MSSRARGQAAERHARLWLERRGLHHVESNYHCALGEIDLVMRERETLVFVEVRLRRSAAFGGAATSVTAAKQRKLMRAVAHYVMTRKVSARHPCRVDVLAIETDGAGWSVDWIQNAVVQGG
ncbi:MAG: YraN family protein [Pseudomonadota bacterium]